jgi:hydrogenase maturation protein HypF
MNIRRHIDFSGIVQGVGFRPYIYRLATECRLAGTIHNTSSGVTVEVEGPDNSVQDFLARIPQNAPPLARITAVSICDVPCVGEREFRIIATDKEETVRTLISPDIATCDDCLRELLDPSDRRYRYPFINCTNCGPRFTITRSLPYDRPSTSMAIFPMCPSCHVEYDDPLNRRFHAQPNACWDCGPKLRVLASTGGEIEGVDPIGYAVSALKAGQIVAVKGLGGFHLAADATNPAAITSLRERKQRVEKPFAIMVASVSRAEELCEVNMAEAVALLSIQRPIVLLSRKDSCPIPEQVAPFNRELGIFLPYTPLHHLLFAEGGFPALVMTSGNLSEEPIAIHNDEARTKLSRLSDCFLLHNREILLRCDDSVVRVPRDPRGGTSRHSVPSAAPKRRNGREPEPQIQQLRRSRGFVPIPIFLHRQAPSVLAVGGELKNTVCLTQGNHAFLSQHIGDLENLEGYRFFEEALAHLRTILEIEPRIIAYDLHPDYFSTKWALQQVGVKRIGVQHHHAHIASCMAENHLDGDVIGIALDGTGYGTDGSIWGGEVLIANYRSFQRAAHFEYVPMPGGAAAIREPWRMAVSYLAHHMGRDFLKFKRPVLDGISCRQIEVVLQMAERKVNSPLTSSCGRLFDAVAALAGIRRTVNYEAQAAIELEMAIPNSSIKEGYPFELRLENDTYIIGTGPLFTAALRDLSDQVSAGVISARFHNGLIGVLVEIANVTRDRTRLDRICLSGGTFNNLYLAESLCQRLRADNFQVFTQREVPFGDGGLSLGQAMVAVHTPA